MQLCVGLAQHLVHLGIVDGVHHARVLAQRHHGHTRAVGFQSLGQRIVVVANRTRVAHLLLQCDGSPDDGHRFGIALHVEQVVGHILQADGQQIAVDDGHLLHQAHGLTGQLESFNVVAHPIVGIAQLRQVVDHALAVANLARRLHCLPTIHDGRVGHLGHVVHLASNAQIVVGVEVRPRGAVGLQGPLHKVFGLVGIAQAQIDNGQVVEGTCLLLQPSVLACQAFRLHFRFHGLGVLARLK